MVDRHSISGVDLVGNPVDNSIGFNENRTLYMFVHGYRSEIESVSTGTSMQYMNGPFTSAAPPRFTDVRVLAKDPLPYNFRTCQIVDVYNGDVYEFSMIDSISGETVMEYDGTYQELEFTAGELIKK